MRISIAAAAPGSLSLHTARTLATVCPLGEIARMYVNVITYLQKLRARYEHYVAFHQFVKHLLSTLFSKPRASQLCPPLENRHHRVTVLD